MPSRFLPFLLLLAPAAALAACPEHSVEIGRKGKQVQCKCIAGYFNAGGKCLPVRYESAAWTPDTQRLVEASLQSIPHAAFKRWVSERVVFKRVSRGMIDSPVTAQPGVITVYDPFFGRGETERKDLLIFEISKVLWMERITPGGREEHTPRRLEFEEIYRRHVDAIYAMRFGMLADNDPESHFGFLLRAAILDLEPPTDAPAQARELWEPAKREIRAYLGRLLRQP
jgi:hypothetical protein